MPPANRRTRERMILQQQRLKAPVVPKEQPVSSAAQQQPVIENAIHDTSKRQFFGMVARKAFGLKP